MRSTYRSNTSGLHKFPTEFRILGDYKGLNDANIHGKKYITKVRQGHTTKRSISKLQQWWLNDIKKLREIYIMVN